MAFSWATIIDLDLALQRVEINLVLSTGSDEQVVPAAAAPEHRQGAAEVEDADRAQEPVEAVPDQHRRRRPQVEIHHPGRNFHSALK